MFLRCANKRDISLFPLLFFKPCCKDENNELTWIEYMLLMVSLNCIVAVRKILSVGDSSFILVRSSFTWGAEHKIFSFNWGTSLLPELEVCCAWNFSRQRTIWPDFQGIHPGFAALLGWWSHDLGMRSTLSPVWPGWFEWWDFSWASCCRGVACGRDSECILARRLQSDNGDLECDNLKLKNNFY